MRAAYRFDLAYDGSPWFGFRQQRDGPTVEGTVLAALAAVCPGWRGRVEVAGATDRGVHALGQVISLRFREAVDVDALVAAMEELAPPATPTPFAALDAVLAGRALRVRAVRAVDWSFHASFTATRRRYRYTTASDVDVARLDAMLRRLEGERDFDAYARKPAKNRSTRKTLHRGRAWRDGDRVWFELEASGFVRRQVRVTVATALREVARGSGPDALVDLAEAGDRRRTAASAPAHGLCLMEVTYP